MRELGRYVLLNELGRGGMGTVFEATDPVIKRPVAVKTIRLEGQSQSERETQWTRLLQEARSAGTLSHPGIVTIHDVGQQDDQAYIVMEFVEGTDLDKILTRGTVGSSRFLFEVLSKAAEALDYAHHKGVIHRDVKPSNIIVTREGSVKLTDFGIANFSGSAALLTQAGFVWGTPAYVSPEQAEGKPLDGRSDQFSLAVIAFRMLCGRLPFAGPTLTGVLSKIKLEEARFDRADLDPKVQSVLRRALHKDPQKRYPSCVDFVRTLSNAYDAARSEAAFLNEMPAPSFFRPKGDKTHPPAMSPEDHVKLALSVQQVFEASGDASSDEDGDDIPMMKRPRRQIVGSAVVVVLALCGLWLMFQYSVQSRVSHRTPVESASGPANAASPAARTVPAEPAIAQIPPDPAKVVPDPVRLPDLRLPPDRPVAAKDPAAPLELPRTRRPSSDTAAPVAAAQHAAPPVRRALEDASLSGEMAWEGHLPSYAELVISGSRPSQGTLAGHLPGFPVTIDVQPRTVTVRQWPGTGNGWKVVTLYSGKESYDWIRIRWRAMK